MARTLLDLPDELLLQLPAHLHNIEDLKNASSSCRRLRTVLAETLPKTILQLAADSAPTFCSPHPYFLVLCVARKLAHWTTALDSECEVRIARLVSAFRGGVHGLLDFALRSDVEGVGITMDDIRRMHLARFSVINPLADTIDAMIGKAWYAQPDFWEGGVESAYTLYTETSVATMQLLIYAELFGPTMEQFLVPKGSRKAVLGPDVRIEFVKYCIPDDVCPIRRTDGFKLDRVGPYDPKNEEFLLGHQTALTHMLGDGPFQGNTWKRAWRRVLIEAGAEANEDGKWPEEWIKVLQKIEWRKEWKGREEDEEVAADGTDDAGNNGTSENAGTGTGEQATGSTPNVVEDEGENETHGNDNDNDDNIDEENEDDGDDEDDEDDEDDSDDEEEEEEVEETQPPFEPPTDYNDGLGDPSSNPPWRFTLFLNALTTASPLSTFSLVAQFKGREEGRSLTVSAEQKSQILALRDKVLALEEDDKPGFKRYGHRWHRISEAPHLAGEAYWCCAGMWPGA